MDSQSKKLREIKQALDRIERLIKMLIKKREADYASLSGCRLTVKTKTVRDLEMGPTPIIRSWKSSIKGLP